jgi:hypothetical protein
MTMKTLLDALKYAEPQDNHQQGSGEEKHVSFKQTVSYNKLNLNTIVNQHSHLVIFTKLGIARKIAEEFPKTKSQWHIGFCKTINNLLKHCPSAQIAYSIIYWIRLFINSNVICLLKRV